jgi:hypothetical protein
LPPASTKARPSSIEGKDHSISLVREQRWFWSSEVEQAVVVSRMPTCMRRHDIKSGVAGSVKMEVFEAGDTCGPSSRARTGISPAPRSASSSAGRTPRRAPGKLVGTFTRKNDKLEFVPADKPPSPSGPRKNEPAAGPSLARAFRTHPGAPLLARRPL